MPFDQSPLFIAAGLCALAMSFALFTAWTTSRADRFLATWTLGMMVLGISVTISVLVPFQYHFAHAAIFAAETLGFFAVYLAALQFCANPVRNKTFWGIAALAATGVAIPMALGASGVALAIYNGLVAVLLVLTAHKFWFARKEAPIAITGVAVLYGVAGLSFAACAAMLIADGTIALSAKPENWAEQFNAIACIVGITVIGALSLSLNQTRVARRHQADALTDTLTGLFNRRALFDNLDALGFKGTGALIVFDLDRFKSVNDRYGHAAGDAVLRHFAATLRDNCRSGDVAARIGGEEFVLLLEGADLPTATLVAQRIGMTFARGKIDTPSGAIGASTSSGVALIRQDEGGIGAALHRADTALYQAKSRGRNRAVAELTAAA